MDEQPAIGHVDVVVALPGGRREWATRLSRWSMSAGVAVELLRCLSADEVRAVLGAGRPVALLLVDATTSDRDLIDLAAELGTPTALVDDGGAAPDWTDLGCVARLDERVGAEELLDLLRDLRRSAAAPVRARAVDLDGPPPPGLLVAVAGAGGSGATTTAMLIADGLGALAPDTPGAEVHTVLVDASATGGLALYHDLVRVTAGLSDLVELHRRDRVDPDRIRALTAGVTTRHYRVLLPGATDAPGRAPSAALAALDGLRRTFAAVVVDTGATVDADHDTLGNPFGDAALRTADVAVVVGRGGLHGLHQLAVTTDRVRRIRGDEPVLAVCAAWRRGVDDRRTAAAASGLPAEQIAVVAQQARLERIHRDVGPLPRRATGVLIDELVRAGLRATPEART